MFSSMKDPIDLYVLMFILFGNNLPVANGAYNPDKVFNVRNLTRK